MISTRQNDKASPPFAIVFFAVPILDSSDIDPKSYRAVANQCLIVLLPVADFVMGFAHHRHSFSGSDDLIAAPMISSMI